MAVLFCAYREWNIGHLLKTIMSHQSEAEIINSVSTMYVSMKVLIVEKIALPMVIFIMHT